MNVLGISGYFHDAAAALVRNGQLVAAAEEERFSRRKHDFDVPARAIGFCLESGGIPGRDLGLVVFFEKPFVKFERILLSTMQTFPRSRGVGHARGRDGSSPDGRCDGGPGVPSAYRAVRRGLNLKGEPIVNTPAEAYRTFERSGMDMLVLGNYLVEKEEDGQR